MLIQDRKVISCASRQFKMHVVNYPTHDLELSVIVFTFKIWWHYLYGIKYKIYTDFQSLKYLYIENDLNMQHHRWLELLTYYDFEFNCHEGQAYLIVDALSKKSSHSLAVLSGVE